MRVLCCALVLASCGWGQRGTGELRVEVVDAGGSPVEAQAELVGQASDLRRTFTVLPQVAYALQVLPFGRYCLSVTRLGFTSESRLLDVQSELPANVKITLGVAPIETALIVREFDTLLNPHEPSAVQHLGSQTMETRRSASPGRGVLELINTQPGWLLEANGVLHPRGSEYQVQYVIDGVPLLDNRSPAFAQSLDVEEFASMSVRTAGYPAEYGRKLGGVIEVTTVRDRDAGLRSKAVVQGGSFGTLSGYLSESYSTSRSRLGFSAEGSFTDRFLDPPVVQNFTNRASANGFSSSFEQDWTERDRTRIYVQRRVSRFLVPNESIQEGAGQRQDRMAQETAGYLSHSHLFSPRVLADFRLMARDTASSLWSNPLATPIAAWQDRGFRETYGSATVSGNFARHEVKAGADFLAGTVRENFRYRIASYRLNPGNVRIFDGDLPANFQFADTRPDREQSAFLQDRWRWKGLSLSVGIRFDRYRLAVRESAWSPRLTASYFFSPLNLVLHASYDRTFETPAVENILLASANRLEDLGGEGAFLPLRPSRGHFYEAGFSKSLFSHLRLDANWYRRILRNFQDDGVLLNTGVSFPIAFSRGDILGFEVKAEVPRWGAFSGFLSYSNLVGRGRGPVSGGLFLGDEADELTTEAATFAITQDQRNTVQARVQFQVLKQLWFAVGGHYYSGLPVEIEGPEETEFWREQYGQKILNQVNFGRGRVRPAAALDLSAGLDLWTHDKRKVRLTADALNATDRLNLINFAGVFSGTAVSAGRTVFLRLHADF